MLLAEHQIASLIVHYSGYGLSTGAITLENLAEDIHAAYAHLRTIVPEDTPIFVLGFSMAQPPSQEWPMISPRPTGIILCQAFSSLRAAAAQITSSRLLAHLLPDCWPPATTLRVLPCPLLLVHTDADPLFPLSMAKELEAATVESLHPVTLAIPPAVATTTFTSVRGTATGCRF